MNRKVGRKEENKGRNVGEGGKSEKKNDAKFNANLHFLLSLRERTNPYKIISLLNRKSRAQRVYALAHAAVSGVQNIYTYLI